MTTKEVGDAGEKVARAFLQKEGMKFIAANYKTPGRGGGEIDLIMLSPEGVLVFVEVRLRRNDHYGGAAASVGRVKQRRITLAAQCYLQQLKTIPPCRFDVVALNGRDVQWIQHAFDFCE